MNQKDLYFLLYLAEKTQLQGSLKTSTNTIATDLKISQQTASRKLVALATAGIITRNVTPTGMTIRVSSKGKTHLHGLYESLNTLFHKKTLTGVVKKGLGEGRFYMLQEQYKKQFHTLFGFVPFAGTLNIVVNPDMIDVFLATKKKLYVKGFETEQRSFGGIHCYSITINNKITGAIIVPDRSGHDNTTIEIIAPVFLRKELQLENGHEVTLE